MRGPLFFKRDRFLVPLDIFRNILHNKDIGNKLEAWLAFLCEDDPKIIVQLIKNWPEFKPMYDEVYTLCRNIQEVMNMFSKELLELDRNTVQYMIDEMQETIERQAQEIEEIKQKAEQEKQQAEMERQKAEQEKQQAETERQKAEQKIAELEALLRECAGKG